MILSEFRCNECGHEFEELVSCHGENISCPVCDSGKVIKLISAPRINTWHVDYSQMAPNQGELEMIDQGILE